MAEALKRKVCTSCNQSLDISSFGRRAGFKDGHRKQCNPCRSRESVAYFKTNEGRSTKTRYRERAKQSPRPKAEPAPCSIKGCGKPAVNLRGWCSNHYYRWRKHGDPNKTVKTLNGETERFFYESVMPYRGSDCFVWPYCRDNNGYGEMTVKGRKVRPHILACEEQYGLRPSREHEAAHSCGKGHLGCCAPSHVSWKTRVENQQDRRLHGTYQNGELNCQATVTEQQVKEIRALRGKMLQREIAVLFGISRRNVGNIQTRRSWFHLD